ncbi:MAG: phosphatidylserine decarboxylase family protein [Aggregatilineales bacterium]
MRIHREGYPTLVTVSSVLAILNVLTWRKNISWLIFPFSLIVWIFFARFFRNPSRTTPDIPDTIFSPADGTIVDIQTVHEPEYFDGERLKISIYMSALNVHVNRVPLKGRVRYVKYHPGKYLVAFHPKASELNERCTIVFADADGREVLVRQIAGLLARRIVTYSKVGQSVAAGQELGFIKFGSRCDVFLPVSATPLVSLEQKVTGGESAIARL